MTFKTSFYTFCLRFSLQKHSSRIFQILWRINEVKIWNPSIDIKRSYYLLQFSNMQALKRGLRTFCMRKWRVFNASIKFSQQPFSSNEDQVKISTVVRKHILEDEAYINHKFWRLKMYLARKAFIIIFAKSFLYILVKLEKALKTPWTHWDEKKTKHWFVYLSIRRF